MLAMARRRIDENGWASVHLIEADAATYDPREREGVQVRSESVRGGHIRVVAATIP